MTQNYKYIVAIYTSYLIYSQLLNDMAKQFIVMQLPFDFYMTLIVYHDSVTCTYALESKPSPMLYIYMYIYPMLYDTFDKSVTEQNHRTK